MTKRRCTIRPTIRHLKDAVEDGSGTTAVELSMGQVIMENLIMSYTAAARTGAHSSLWMSARRFAPRSVTSTPAAFPKPTLGTWVRTTKLT